MLFCHLGGATSCIKFTLHNYRQFLKTFICSLRCLHTTYIFIQLRMSVITSWCSYLNGTKDWFLQIHGKKSVSLWILMNKNNYSASRPSTIHYHLFARGKHPHRRKLAGTVRTCLRCKVQQFSLKCWWQPVCAKTADFALRHVQVLHPARPTTAGTGQTAQLDWFCLQQPQSNLPGCLCPCPQTERVGKLHCSRNASGDLCDEVIN